MASRNRYVEIYSLQRFKDEAQIALFKDPFRTAL